LSVFILDSNIVSFYIRHDHNIVQKVNEVILAGHEVIISPIAYYEVKRGLQAVKAEKRLKEFKLLCKVFGVGQLDNSILDISSDIYCDLREKKQTVEDADILTAVFCISHGFTLVTNNTKDFVNISGLNYCDWV
jgi:tRNA(fMet)-specific endonuclease VapC